MNGSVFFLGEYAGLMPIWEDVKICILKEQHVIG